MNNRTPKFNEAIEEILQGLKPHQKKCQECGNSFDVMVEDIEFYKKMQVPPNNLCFFCTMQKLASSRYGFVPVFYKKSCAVSGHQEKIIAMYAEENPVKVYDDSYYLSDQWDAEDFGITYNVVEDFFEQYKNFALAVPHQSLFKDPQSVNSDYVIAGKEIKDCYYCTIAINSEKVYYSFLPVGVKDSVSLSDIQNSEQCYDCIDGNRLYKCIFCIESSNCMESSFLYDCKNCQNCFMSANLRNKSFVFRNQQLDKSEYQEKMKEINLGKRSEYAECQKEFQRLIKNSIKKKLRIIKSENCFGDNIISSKNCFYTSRVFKCENIRYGMSFTDSQDLMSCFGGLGTSLAYMVTAFYDSNNIKFCSAVRNLVDCEYCFECNNCENCFACFGLKNKKYYIFNKSYSEDEYWQRVDELKTKMLEKGEYGEFLPMQHHPLPYQDSAAQAIFPLSEEEIKNKRWHWQDKVESEIDLTKIKTVLSEDIPDDIKDVDDNILRTPVICKKTGRPFKILPYELRFYRQMNLPLPSLHPEERFKEKFIFKPVYNITFYNTHCAKCRKEIKTVHNPEETENIYCEKCYNREVE